MVTVLGREDLPCADRRIPQTLFHPLERSPLVASEVGQSFPPARILWPIGEFCCCHRRREAELAPRPELRLHHHLHLERDLELCEALLESIRGG
jgi:hypothetical protein